MNCSKLYCFGVSRRQAEFRKPQVVQVQYRNFRQNRTIMMQMQRSYKEMKRQNRVFNGLQKRQWAKSGSAPWLFVVGLVVFACIILFAFQGGSGLRSLKFNQAEAQEIGELNADQQIARNIQQIINEHRVTVFSRSTCPYSQMAKEVFNRVLGQNNYYAFELDLQVPDLYQQYKYELARITGGNTVPRVFIDGEFIGGGTELVDLEQNGELTEILQSKNIV